MLNVTIDDQVKCDKACANFGIKSVGKLCTTSKVGQGACNVNILFYLLIVEIMLK